MLPSGPRLAAKTFLLRPPQSRRRTAAVRLSTESTRGYPTVRAPVFGRLEAGLPSRSEEHTSELQSRGHLVCRLLLEKKNMDKQLFLQYKAYILTHTTHILST